MHEALGFFALFMLGITLGFGLRNVNSWSEKDRTGSGVLFLIMFASVVGYAVSA